MGRPESTSPKVVRALRSRSRKLASSARSAAIRAEQRLSPSDLLLPRDRVPSYWYHGTPNFGDLLSPELLGEALGLRGVWVPPSYQGKVLFIGSIINCLAPGDLVIGSGAITDRPHELPASATIVGLRGPRTAQLLGLRTKVPFGDPGLIAASLFGISRSVTNGRIAVIPHFVDVAEVRRMHDGSKTLRDSCDILDVATEPRTLITQISAYDACISSSLHGVVIAESLGIPTVPVRFGDRLAGGKFKFADYFEGTGRSFEGLSSMDTAFSTLEQGSKAEPDIDLSPVFRMLEHAAEVLGRPRLS